jgi:hypothetical protein
VPSDEPFQGAMGFIFDRTLRSTHLVLSPAVDALEERF